MNVAPQVNRFNTGLQIYNQSEIVTVPASNQTFHYCKLSYISKLSCISFHSRWEMSRIQSPTAQLILSSSQLTMLWRTKFVVRHSISWLLLRMSCAVGDCSNTVCRVFWTSLSVNGMRYTITYWYMTIQMNMVFWQLITITQASPVSCQELPFDWNSCNLWFSGVLKED